MAIFTSAQFNKLTREDLEYFKFALDASGKISVRFIQGLSSRGAPVKTRADLPATGVVNGEARIVWNDPLLSQTIAIRDGSDWKEMDTSYTLNCADVKTCIENFTTLDLTNAVVTLEEIGGDISFFTGTTIDRTNTTNTGIQNFDEDYIANYDGSEINYVGITQNWEGDSIVNLEDGNSITFNYDGEINNTLGDTYVENNIYTAGAVVNNTGIIENNYDNYTENNVYNSTSVVNNTGGTVNNINQTVNHINQTINYDNSTEVVYEGSVTFEGDTIVNNLIVEGDMKLSATTTAGTATVYTMTFTDYDTYIDNDVFIVNFHTTNGDDPTLNIEGVGALNLKDGDGDNLTSGALDINTPYLCRYDSVGACIYVQLGGSGGTVTTGDVSRQTDDFTAVTTQITLSKVPADEDAIVILTDSGTNLIQGVDWDWNTTIATRIIDFSPSLGSATIYVKYPVNVGSIGVSGITAYSIEEETMNGTTNVVITDSRIVSDTPFNIYYETQPAGNITKTLANGSLTIVSDDVSDTMDFKVVFFGFGNKSTYTTSAVFEIDGAGPRTVTDGRITEDTPVNLFPLTDPDGYLTVEAGDGEIVITSTGTESNLEVRYIAFTELELGGSILDTAYGSGWDGDTENAPSRNAVYDKIESIPTGSDVKSGEIITRVANASSGAVTYSHNLGRTPNFIEFSYNNMNNHIGFGFYDGTNNKCAFGEGTDSGYCIYAYEGPSDYQKGKVTSVTDTDFTITWEENSMLSGTNININVILS